MQYDKDQQSGLNDDETNRINGRRPSQRNKKQILCRSIPTKEKRERRPMIKGFSRSRKSDFHAKSNWNLFATTLPSYEINTMPLLETDTKKP